MVNNENDPYAANTSSLSSVRSYQTGKDIATPASNVSSKDIPTPASSSSTCSDIAASLNRFDITSPLIQQVTTAQTAGGQQQNDVRVSVDEKSRTFTVHFPGTSKVVNGKIPDWWGTNQRDNDISNNLNGELRKICDDYYDNGKIERLKKEEMDRVFDQYRYLFGAFRSKTDDAVWAEINTRYSKHAAYKRRIKQISDVRMKMPPSRYHETIVKERKRQGDKYAKWDEDVEQKYKLFKPGCAIVYAHKAGEHVSTIDCDLKHPMFGVELLGVEGDVVEVEFDNINGDEKCEEKLDKIKARIKVPTDYAMVQVEAVFVYGGPEQYHKCSDSTLACRGKCTLQVFSDGTHHPLQEGLKKDDKHIGKKLFVHWQMLDANTRPQTVHGSAEQKTRRKSFSTAQQNNGESSFAAPQIRVITAPDPTNAMPAPAPITATAAQVTSNAPLAQPLTNVVPEQSATNGHVDIPSSAPQPQTNVLLQLVESIQSLSQQVSNIQHDLKVKDNSIQMLQNQIHSQLRHQNGNALKKPPASKSKSQLAKGKLHSRDRGVVDEPIADTVRKAGDNPKQATLTPSRSFSSKHKRSASKPVEHLEYEHHEIAKETDEEPIVVDDEDTVINDRTDLDTSEDEFSTKSENSPPPMKQSPQKSEGQQYVAPSTRSHKKNQRRRQHN